MTASLLVLLKVLRIPYIVARLIPLDLVMADKCIEGSRLSLRVLACQCGSLWHNYWLYGLFQPYWFGIDLTRQEFNYGSRIS